MYMLDYYFFFISIFLLKPQGNPTKLVFWAETNSKFETRLSQT